MSGPLIPYVTLPELTLLGHHSFSLAGRAYELGPWSIKPFGTLVALGVYLGLVVTMRLARRRGLHPEAMSRFIFWVLVFAFVGGHVLDTLFYHPEQVLRDPLSLVKIWAGLSSYGGFMGACIGVFVFKARFHVKHIMPFTDTMGAAFPLGWVFGRMGCSVVHDHPGLPSHLWFAVKYPDGSGGRFDLGLYEMLFAVLVAICAMVLARKPRPPGFFTGFTMLAYAPTRFALDFMRAIPGDAKVSEADPRYLMLTPAQWAAIAMAMAGTYFLYKACGSGAVGNEPYQQASAELDLAAIARPNRSPPPP